MNDLVFGLDSLSINQSTNQDMNRRPIFKSYHTTTSAAATPYGNIDWSFPPKKGNFLPSSVAGSDLFSRRPNVGAGGSRRPTSAAVVPLDQKNKNVIQKGDVFSPPTGFVFGQKFSTRNNGGTHQPIKYDCDDSIFDRFRSFSVQNNPTSAVATRNYSNFINENNVRKQRCGSDSSTLKILDKNFFASTTATNSLQKIQNQRRQNLNSVSSVDYQGLYRFCSFCKMNNETQKVYEGHELFHRGTTRVQCPYLRGYVCPICKCTGDYAHTMSYCPQNPDGKQKTYRQRMTSKRLSCGKFRKD